MKLPNASISRSSQNIDGSFVVVALSIILSKLSLYHIRPTISFDISIIGMETLINMPINRPVRGGGAVGALQHQISESSEKVHNFTKVAYKFVKIKFYMIYAPPPNDC